MWETFLLAGAGGSLVSVGMWEFLVWVGKQSMQRELTRRLQRITGRGEPADRAAVPLRDARYSDFLALDRIIRRFSIIARIARFLQQAGSKLNVGSFVLLHMVCLGAGIAVTAGLRAPILIAVPVSAAIGMAPLTVVAAKRRRRLNQLTEQLPDAIRLISSSLRAGLGLDVGLNEVVTELPDPIRGEFAQLVNEALLEFNMNDAFRRFARRIPISDYKLFASAACLHREVGGNFAELLDELEETLRDRVRLHRELRTTTALSRFEGLFLGVLPVLVSLALFSLNPTYYRPFREDPVGRMLLVGAIALQLIGFGLIRWMIRLRAS